MNTKQTSGRTHSWKHRSMTAGCLSGRQRIFSSMVPPCRLKRASYLGESYESLILPEMDRRSLIFLFDVAAGLARGDGSEGSGNANTEDPCLCPRAPLSLCIALVTVLGLAGWGCLFWVAEKLYEAIFE